MSDQPPRGVISPQSQIESEQPAIVIDHTPSQPLEQQPVVTVPLPQPLPISQETAVPQAPAQNSAIPQQPIQLAQPTEERTTPFMAEEEYDGRQAEVSGRLEPVAWTASEYIAHKKQLSWYLALVAIVAVLTVFIFIITGGDLISTLSVLVLAVIFGLYAGRQPKEQQYVLDEKGVSIGSRTYGFDILKSFSVMDEGPFSSIVFMPMKRFMPLISIYYDPVDEDKIIEYLTAIMPMEYRKHDNIERLMHKIKF